MLSAGEDETRVRTLRWTRGTVVDADESAAATPYDADGALVLPGIVDVHGDAFERSLMPRSGVFADVALALVDNDAQLLTSGITTSYLSATDSWEPGLRSRSTLRRLVEAMNRRIGGPDVRLHVRHERCNTNRLDELLDWIADGTVSMLSYNDHTPGGIAHIDAKVGHGQVRRSGVAEAELQSLLDAAVVQRAGGLEQERRLAAAARRVGCVTASHDSSSIDDLRRDVELGVSIAEFPMTVDLAREYRERGFAVLLGAPNLVRGSSHLGNLSALGAFEAGLDPILCSDYHYPSLLQAPFALADSGIVGFAEAWAAVSKGPARAAGLHDRGELGPGTRADIVVVRPPEDGRPARVTAAFVAGRLVFQTP